MQVEPSGSGVLAGTKRHIVGRCCAAQIRSNSKECDEGQSRLCGKETIEENGNANYWQKRMRSFSATRTGREVDRNELTGQRIEDGHGSLLCCWHKGNA
jgi:hypothetical protein